MPDHDARGEQCERGENEAEPEVSHRGRPYRIEA